MTLAPTTAVQDSTEETDQLLFALHHRDAPTVVFMECNSYDKRRELAALLRTELTEYQFHDIDVTSFSVVSLLRTLTENLPPAIVDSQPVQYVVNVYGLENSLLVSEDGQIKPSMLTAQLNLERELLFRNVPYVIVIWADHYFFQTLQRESPDLWSWVVYRFRFEGTNAIDPENLPPLPPERLPQRGNIAERQQRIEELEATYNRLNLDTSDKKRLLKDKVSILKLLAEEYTEAFRYDEAQKTYEDAIAIAERMRESEDLRGNLYFNVANVQLARRLFSNALANYNRSLSLAGDRNRGSIYHQIGMVYQMQRQWTQALDSYQLALNWKEKTGNAYELGGTYHQIGMVYQMQRQWTQALDSYQLTLNWKEKTGNAYELGSTYHQMGDMFLKKNEMGKALDYLNKALKNCIQFGHPQVNMVREAIASIDSDSQTGNGQA